jgi:hypothetical protein
VQMRSARWRSMPGERISNFPVRLCGLWVTDALTTGALQGSTTARNLRIVNGGYLRRVVELVAILVAVGVSVKILN